MDDLRQRRQVIEDFGLEASDWDTAAQILAAQRAGDQRAPDQWNAVSKHLLFYHGTSWERAQAIGSEGFRVSEEGCLGRGVYVGRKDKALNFARSKSRHGGAEGGLVTAIISFEYPKFTSGDCDDWTYEGYDACRAERTSRSDKMEWCVREPGQVQVHAIEQVTIDDGDDEYVPEEVLMDTGDSRVVAHGGADLVNSWRCSQCGTEGNKMWRSCESCGARKPLQAIEQAVSVAHTVLARPVDLATQSRQEVAYKIGAMGGWVVAQDDAQAGAPHRPALGNTALMLPPPTEKKHWAERPPSFHAALDAVQQQAMPPPPPRPSHFSQGHGSREMPPRKRGREWDDDSRSGSQPTSDFSYHSTAHSRQRAEERELLRRQLQACIKHGRCTLEGANKFRFVHDGITLITDQSKKIGITAFRGSSSGGGELHLMYGQWPFDLERPAHEPPPETPRSPYSSSGRDSRSGSRSRSASVSRDQASSSSFVGSSLVTSGGPGLGTIREYQRASDEDQLEQIKRKARLVNDVALSGGARDAGVLWVCDSCGSRDNVAWNRCINCAQKFPEECAERAKKSARMVLDEPHTLGKAAEGNEYRGGVIAGYAYGRIRAVAEEGDRPHPAAFAREHVALMPPRPAQEECSLPDERVLAIKVAYGATPWPEEA